MSHWTPIFAEIVDKMLSVEEWTRISWCVAFFLLGLLVLLAYCPPKVRLLPAGLACGWAFMWLSETLDSGGYTEAVFAEMGSSYAADTFSRSFIPASVVLVAMVIGHLAQHSLPQSAQSAIGNRQSAIP
ncbi:MAG: hypothetical protein HZA92_20115 [Verrucomicrobia bacterium]|nr:hypothetical protein [Verrucomicrobiota bacterium]